MCVCVGGGGVRVEGLPMLICSPLGYLFSMCLINIDGTEWHQLYSI